MPKDSSTARDKKGPLKIYDVIITITTSFIFFLVPLFFTGLVSQGIIFEKIILFYLLLLLGMVAWIAKGVSAGELKIKRTPLDLPIAILAIILLLSTIFSVDKSASFVGAFGSTTKSFVAFIAYIAFYYLVVNNINAKRLYYYFWAILLSGAIIIVFSTFQLFDIFWLPFAATRINSFNPVGNLSSLGIYIASLLPILAVAVPILTERKRNSATGKVFSAITQIIIAVIALIALFVLLLLNNFVYWPIAIVGIVLLLMFVLAKVIVLKQKDIIIPVAIFLILIVLLMGGGFNLFSLNLPTEISLSRNLSWEIAKNSLSENMLLGTGPATFDYAFAKYRGTEFNQGNLWSVRFDTAGGNFFEMLSTVGILGFFGFLIIGLIIISITFINLTKPGEKTIKIFSLGLLSTTTILVINALISSVSGTIILLIVLLTTLLMALIIFDYPEKFEEVSLSFRTSPKYALALAAVFLLVSAGVVVLFTFGFKMYLADYYANKVNIRETLEETLDDLSKAITTFDQNDQYFVKRAKVYSALANQELQTENMENVRLYISDAIADGKKAVDLAPNSVVNSEALALVYEQAAAYGINGSLEWAEKYYLRCAELEPDNPTPYIRLALIKMAQANAESSEEEKTYFYDEAVRFYEQAISKKTNLAPAYYGLAIVYERKGDYDKAIEQLGKAVGLVSNNIDYRFELGRMYFNRAVSSQNLQQQQSTEIIASENEDENAVAEDDLSVTGESSKIDQAAASEDLEIAKALFEMIINVSPNHANAIYSLAMVFESTGNREQARENYRKLLDIVTDEATKDAIRQKINSL